MQHSPPKKHRRERRRRGRVGASALVLHMPLDDAVRRLRGVPGTKVSVFVRREGEGGWQGDKKFELVREQIKVSSVVAKMFTWALLPLDWANMRAPHRAQWEVVTFAPDSAVLRKGWTSPAQAKCSAGMAKAETQGAPLSFWQQRQ